MKHSHSRSRWVFDQFHFGSLYLKETFLTVHIPEQQKKEAEKKNHTLTPLTIYEITIY